MPGPGTAHHRTPASLFTLWAALWAALLAGTAQSSGPTGEPPATRDVRTIQVPGSRLVIRTWHDRARGVSTPHYEVTRDGAVVVGPRATSYAIKLRHGAFDPHAGAGQPVESGFEAGPDTNLYIVQFVTQPLPAYRAAIRDLGGTPYSFLAQHSHVVRIPAHAVDAVKALPFVRWVGPFHPAYKLEEFMLRNADDAEALFPRPKYNIMVFEPGMAQKRIVAQRIREIGGIVHREHAGKFLLEATLTPAQLFAAVRWDEVCYIDRWSPGEADMDIVRDVSGADFVESVAGYTGAGVRGEVLDLGFNLDHRDFDHAPLILHTATDENPHGAACAGICFGDGNADPTARGMLPDGQGIVADWHEVSIGSPRYDHTAELVQAPYEAVFQTASTGSARTTFYTTISADTDAMLFDFDIVHCQSQSNAGNQESRPEAWAKNIIAGGGAFHANTAIKTDDSWSGGASTGPAADGRVKPDLVFFYDLVHTVWGPGRTDYNSAFGGTSAATPMICACAGLFFEMWADGIFGNVVDPEGTVFENRAHMTTAKAVLVNTATQYDWSAGGSNADLTRMRQGWGLPDMQRVLEFAQAGAFFIVNEDDLVANGETVAYDVAMSGVHDLKATLVYADPPGVPFAAQHRINDLSLKVTSPSGTTYWGNHGLLDGLWSTPGGAANEIDTVENVFVQTPEAGTWTVEIIASEINEDGHVETPELDADFALVVSGVRPECTADLNGDDVADFADIVVLLANWGPCGECPQDIDENGVIDFADVLIVIGAWGPCP